MGKLYLLAFLRESRILAVWLVLIDTVHERNYRSVRIYRRVFVVTIFCRTRSVEVVNTCIVSEVCWNTFRNNISTDVRGNRKSVALCCWLFFPRQVLGKCGSISVLERGVLWHPTFTVYQYILVEFHCSDDIRKRSTGYYFGNFQLVAQCRFRQNILIYFVISDEAKETRRLPGTIPFIRRLYEDQSSLRSWWLLWYSRHGYHLME
jgi:hypothetical protein